MRKIILTVAILIAMSGIQAIAQEEKSEGGQDRETMALDSTATQWSFQLAYQKMPDYHDDTLDNGQQRPEGADNYWQLRIVAPLPFNSFTVLPRVTFRHYETPQGDSGFGNTEISGLIIPKSWDWTSGRTGIGPLVTLPGDPDVARDEWGYGFAAAAVNSTGKWYYGLLLTQTWRAVDPEIVPPTDSDTNPLGIAPFLQLPRWEKAGMWATATWSPVTTGTKTSYYLPIGIRVGNVIVGKKSSWNIYGRVSDQPPLRRLVWFSSGELGPNQRDLYPPCWFLKR